MAKEPKPIMRTIMSQRKNLTQKENTLKKKAAKRCKKKKKEQKLFKIDLKFL